MSPVLKAKVGGEWVEIGGVGPQGPAGPTGAQGPAGAAGQGVPAGGTTGQVLAKNSAANYDTGWVTPTSGGGGGSQLFTAAGAFNFTVPDGVTVIEVSMVGGG